MLGSWLVKIDASHLYGNLYMGSRPPIGKRLAYAGFDVVVLAAQEYQPPEWRLPGVEVIYAPMEDVPVVLRPNDLAAVRRVVARVAQALATGRRVLVSCRAGLNRSGLIAGAVLLETTNMTPLQVISLIRKRRSIFALNNPAFVHALTTQFRHPQSVQG